MSADDRLTSGDTDAAVAFLLQWTLAIGTTIVTLSAIDPVSGKIKSGGFHTAQEGDIRSFIAKYNGNWNLYFGPNLPSEPSSKRLSEKDVQTVVCLHVDVDPRDGLARDGERSRILKVLEDFQPAPTVIIDSGGGYQAFWLLINPVDAPDEKQRIKNLNAGIAKQLGGDKCHSLDHIMRLPGTVNVPNERKINKGRVRALASLLQFSDARYDPEKFERLQSDEGTGEISTHWTAEQLRPVKLEALHLPKSLEALIRDGRLPHAPDRFEADRSAALYYAICGMVRAGLRDEDILSVLTAEENAISEKPLEKKNALEWLIPQLSKARRSLARAVERYRATRDGIVVLTQQKGQTVPVALTNFNATIVAEHIRDDGSADVHRTFVIEGELANGTGLARIEVAASEFEQMKWVTEKWGSTPNTIPQRMHRDHVASAIRTLSGTPKVETIYLHTGWKQIDGQFVYLHADGGIGADGAVPGVLVDLPDGMKDYRLGAPKNVAVEIRSSLEMASLADGKIGYALLAGVYRSVLSEFLPVTFSIFLEGGSGAFKSSVTALAQAHFGNKWSTSHLPASWQNTENALERQAFLAKDALLIVDDFTPAGDRYTVNRLHASAERLLRGQGNLSGRQRLKADASFRPSFKPRGLIVSSGEDVPEGKSLGARMLIIDVEPGDISRQMLSRLQTLASDGMFARATAGFIQWLAGQAKNLPDSLHARFDKLRSEAPGDHSRTPENAAHALLGIEQFLKYAEEVGAISSQEAASHLAQAKKSIGALAREQTAHIRTEDVATRFIGYLGSALRMGRAHLVDSKREEMPDNGAEVGWANSETGWRAGGDRVGWVDGSAAYLDLKAAMTTVQRVARESSDNIGFRQKGLTRELRNAGYISSSDPDRNLLLKTLGGRRVSVLHLDLAAVIGVADDEADAIIPKFPQPVNSNARLVQLTRSV